MRLSFQNKISENDSTRKKFQQQTLLIYDFPIAQWSGFISAFSFFA
jgi:hypothetical protein